ncbi:MAG: TVP38/TMEM64 family protein [Granulosicoccus sp.]
MSRLPARRRIAGAALLILLALIIGLSVTFPPKDYVPAAKWGAILESSGLAGMALFLVAGILATSVGLPRQLVAFIGGLAYGVGLGLCLSLLAALCGCWLTVTMSRRFFAATVTARFPRPIAALDRLTRQDLFLKILVLRLQPLGTNLLTNVCIGFTSASVPKFIAASALGYVPQMLVFNLLGVGIRVDSQAQLILSIVLLLVSIALGVFLYKRHIKSA